MSMYRLSGKSFTQKQLVFGQLVWIRDILCGKKLNSMTANEYTNVIIGNFPKFLAIVLLRENETQADKVKSGDDGVTELEDWIKGNIPAEELFAVGMAVMNDFFDFNPGEVAILIDGEIKIPVRVPDLESASTG